VQKAFFAYDDDASGFIDKDEFKKFAKDLLAIISETSGIEELDILGGKEKKDWIDAEFAVG